MLSNVGINVGSNVGINIKSSTRRMKFDAKKGRNNSVADKVANKVANKVAKRVAKKQWISQKSNITIKELVEVSGYSDGYIRKILASLKEKKVIERQGGNKTGKWVVIC